MPFICGGFPTVVSTGETLLAIQGAGASIVEVGIPFSDPIADGPVIAAAMHTALAAGATPGSVFDAVASVRSKLSIGVVAMCSISIVHRMSGTGGPAEFCGLASRAGFDGLIIPDMPLEESGALRAAAAAASLSLSLLIAPTTPPERAAAIARASTGFVYLLARAGITGESGAPPDIRDRVRVLRSVTDLPIACGFGISTAEHVRAVVSAGEADAAIIGSALIRRQTEAVTRGEDASRAAAEFVRSLAAGCSPK